MNGSEVDSVILTAFFGDKKVSKHCLLKMHSCHLESFVVGLSPNPPILFVLKKFLSFEKKTLFSQTGHFSTTQLFDQPS